MATVILRPNANLNEGWAVVGAASVEAALSDDSDASYITSATDGLSVIVDFTTTVLPSLSQVRSVTARLRNQITAGTGTLRSLTYFAGGVFRLQDVTATTTLQTSTYPAQATTPSGGAIGQTEVDYLELLIQAYDTAPDTMRVYEAYIDVLYNEAPVATVTVPAEASTITNDSTPDVSWTYSDAEADVQERYQVKVFTTAQFSAGGFDPATSTATWDSGSVLSAGTTATVGVILANTVYRAYVRVADVGSGGRFGAWDFNQFTLNVTPPPVPTLTATADNTLKRVTLSATSAGAPAVEFMDFQYSEDLGVTWFPVRNGTRLVTTAGVASVIDYESKPNTARQYRALAGRLV